MEEGQKEIKCGSRAVNQVSRGRSSWGEGGWPGTVLDPIGLVILPTGHWKPLEKSFQQGSKTFIYALMGLLWLLSRG